MFNSNVCVVVVWCLSACQAIYNVMSKPAFVFDGRNILPHAALREIGFEVYAIGKPEPPTKKF